MDKMGVETAAETLLGKVKKDRIWSQMGDMDMDQFREVIKQMYLPFTLRQMYYREL